ncbi:hypothetical protein MJ391_23050 [Escherichia coli]|nr:hypothetical protein MJ391_23050 [Escherichia coli]
MCSTREVDFTYQYLWDHHFSNLKRKRHQRSIATAFRKSVTKGLQSLFVGFTYRLRHCKQLTDNPTMNNICAIPSPPRLEPTGVFRNTERM